MSPSYIYSTTYIIENRVVYRVDEGMTPLGNKFTIKAAVGGVIWIEETETEVVLHKAYIAEDARSWWYEEKERLPMVYDDPETPDVDEHEEFMQYIYNDRVMYWEEHDE
jgi:hypothetical protein